MPLERNTVLNLFPLICSAMWYGARQEKFKFFELMQKMGVFVRLLSFVTMALLIKIFSYCHFFVRLIIV